jgi:dGTPase
VAEVNAPPDGSTGTDADPYTDADRERRHREPGHRSGRTAFQRDRARVLHASALRRLAAKTQVHQAFAADFPRTRLTHSLEAAQIGRELASALGADPDAVDAACLAHDLGHPPFGHNGEAALDDAAAGCGGFEGNAQSLRILTRLEVKIIDPSGTSHGLNLTRATLDATLKYPWPRPPEGGKFGAYDDDRAALDWIRLHSPGRRRAFEAQIMEWADDVAYSVHDLEDALHDGGLDPCVLDDAQERDELLRLCAARYARADDGSAGDVDRLAAALERLRSLPEWLGRFDGGVRSSAATKALTSALIGRFCVTAEQATREATPTQARVRHHADLAVPEAVRDECAVLKAMTARYIMDRADVEARYRRERDVVAALVDAVHAGAPGTLDPLHAEWFAAAGDDRSRLRVVIDQVSSLTDTSALAWHSRLVRATRRAGAAPA